MATQAQTLANQANSKHSTGPRTPEGKAAVKHNAIKHGIFANAIPLDTALYPELLLGLFEALKPEDEPQRMLVEQIAVTIVRIKRAVRHEQAYIECIDYNPETGGEYSALGAYMEKGPAALTNRYENSLNRLLQRLFRLYREMKKDMAWWSIRNHEAPSPYLYHDDRRDEISAPPAQNLASQPEPFDADSPDIEEQEGGPEAPDPGSIENAGHNREYDPQPPTTESVGPNTPERIPMLPDETDCAIENHDPSRRAPTAEPPPKRQRAKSSRSSSEEQSIADYITYLAETQSVRRSG